MYHFSDVLSVLSNEDILLLDIHKKWLPKGCESMKGNLVQQGLLKKYPGQFEPFQQQLWQKSWNKLLNRFEGTLFRLPIRTAANESDIKSKPFSIKDIEEMLIQAGKSLCEMLTFLQNVERISIYVSCNNFVIANTNRERKTVPLQDCITPKFQTSRMIYACRGHLKTKRQFPCQASIRKLSPTIYRRVCMIKMTKRF
jgi:hypothetical protein